MNLQLLLRAALCVQHLIRIRECTVTALQIVCDYDQKESLRLVIPVLKIKKLKVLPLS